MVEWTREHAALLQWLSAVSFVVFVGSLIAVPWVLVRLPADHFVGGERRPRPWAGQHPAVRSALVIGRNLLGGLLVVAGIAMLVLPGQGLLSILVGIMLLDVPGKHRLVRWLVSRPAVWQAIAWLRRRAGRPPLDPASA